jgi:hypothetical protein
MTDSVSTDPTKEESVEVFLLDRAVRLFKVLFRRVTGHPTPAPRYPGRPGGGGGGHARQDLQLRRAYFLAGQPEVESECVIVRQLAKS